MLNKIFIEGYEYIHRNIRIDRGHDYNLPNSITYFHLTSKPIDEISSELLLQGGSFNNLNSIGEKHVTRQSKDSC